jgi:hypothetical protein
MTASGVDGRSAPGVPFFRADLHVFERGEIIVFSDKLIVSNIERIHLYHRERVTERETV